MKFSVDQHIYFWKQTKDYHGGDYRHFLVYVTISNYLWNSSLIETFRRIQLDKEC